MQANNYSGWIGEPMGVFGFWSGLTAALATVAIAVSIRLAWRRQ